LQNNLQEVPKGPYLLDRFNPGQGGVDFLGLRQVNLDLMAECIPGINNVTWKIRPYSVMCWIYWKFYRLMQGKGMESPSETEMTRFREKVESLFLWGHQLGNLRGIPGFLAKPTEFRGGRANLSFESWKRDARNTSIQAGVQYGPSLSDRGGLGFLHRVEGSFYKVTASGEALGKVLDERLRKRKGYAKLIDLQSMRGSEAEAMDLFVAWRADSPGADERNIFRESFFNESGVDEDNAIGVRSAAVCLIQDILRKSRIPLSQNEIRKSMVYRRLPTGKQIDVSGGKSTTAKKWLVLQVRQAQRLALESLMAWVEHRILNIGERDSRQLTKSFVLNLRTHASKLFTQNTPAEILMGWLGRFKKLDDYLDAALKDPLRFCIFELCEELETAIDEDPEIICVPAFKLLLLVRRFYEWLGGDDELLPYLLSGRAERISLGYWAKTWDKNSTYPLADLVALILSNMILSQHFAVATNRFDGGTQRLRITIEEDGLEALIAKPWRPYITADRLGTVLSLMADCGLLKQDADEERYYA
jgi:hypothetical protein